MIPICLYARDTGRRWCNCRAFACTEVECHNPARLAALLPNGERRYDGAAYHTRYLEKDANDRANAEFVLVRSKFCNETHCRDFAPVLTEKT